MKKLIVPIALSMALSGTARAEGFEDLAKEIARLRSSIDELNQRLEDEKEAQRNQLRSLAQQKLSLEAEAQKEAQRRDQLAHEVQRLEEKGKKSEARTSSLKSVASSAIDRMKPVLDSGVPFRRNERAAELASIRLELDEGRTSPAGALSRLWKFAESELALTKSLSVESQVITIDGREMLADVARAGTVLLYFRTPDGRFGAARSVGGSWKWDVIAAPEDTQRITAFFAALENRQREGFFTLPGALAPIVTLSAQTETK